MAKCDDDRGCKCHLWGGRLLVEVVVGGGKSAEAANQALAALGSYNRTNRLAQVDELVGHIRLGHNEVRLP
jgi:hypothetical protein